MQDNKMRLQGKTEGGCFTSGTASTSRLNMTWGERSENRVVQTIFREFLQLPFYKCLRANTFKILGKKSLSKSTFSYFPSAVTSLQCVL